MNGYRSGLSLAVLTGLMTLCGAGCSWFQRFMAPEPRVLPPSPSLEQVIQTVNQVNSQVHSFTTNQATLSMPGRRPSGQAWRFNGLGDCGFAATPA